MLHNIYFNHFLCIKPLKMRLTKENSEESFDNSFYYPTFASQKQDKLIGALVQLVRIHACHAWGHGFESRTHRKEPKRFLFFVRNTLTRDPRVRVVRPKRAHQATQSSPVRTARNQNGSFFFVRNTLTRDPLILSHATH